MYFFPSNANIQRGQVTVDIPDLTAHTTTDVAVPFAAAAVGNSVSVEATESVPSGIVLSVPSAVETAGTFTIRVANITASSIGAQSDVVFNVAVAK